MFVRDRHEHRSADAGLQILFGGVFDGTLELLGQSSTEGGETVADRYFIVAHTEALHHVARIGTLCSIYSADTSLCVHQ